VLADVSFAETSSAKLILIAVKAAAINILVIFMYVVSRFSVV